VPRLLERQISPIEKRFHQVKLYPTVRDLSSLPGGPWGPGRLSRRKNFTKMWATRSRCWSSLSAARQCRRKKGSRRLGGHPSPRGPDSDTESGSGVWRRVAGLGREGSSVANGAKGWKGRGRGLPCERLVYWLTPSLHASRFRNPLESDRAVKAHRKERGQLATELSLMAK